MIVKIHGTSGAGKTTVVRNLMEMASTVDPIILEGAKKPEAYRLEFPYLHHPIFVLGNYDNACGGMDCVTSVDDQIALIEKYAHAGHILYEGLLMSTYYGKLGTAMEKYGKFHAWAFLDTPVEVCIERVKQRRLAAGNTKPLNERNTRERLKPINSLKAKLTRLGAKVYDLPYDEEPHLSVMEIIRAGERRDD